MDKDKPIVSICCITYNHEKYLRQALDSFISQKTTFNYEIVISNDCSSDSTQEIVDEYKNSYPDLIKDISPKQNMGALNNFFYTMKNARGKYIALCEGDDYWIDDMKLQSQVSFLESNPDYQGCFHATEVIAEAGLSTNLYTSLKDKDYSSNDILLKWTVPTASVMFNSDLVKLIPNNSDFIYGDIVCFLTITSNGKFHCFNKKMSAYRRTFSGAIGSQKKNTNMLVYKKTDSHYKAIRKEFPKVSLILIFFLRLKNQLFKIRFLLKNMMEN